MPKLPCVSGQEAIRAFEAAGFALSRIRGSHHIMWMDGRDPLSVPVHGGKSLKPGTLRGLIKTAGLTVKEFLELLDK
jgi:predicted RNA binding protein YcfA (HicA-like mRNA interferase family)